MTGYQIAAINFRISGYNKHILYKDITEGTIAMNEMSAWNRFCETGKIADYLTYRELRSVTEWERKGDADHETGNTGGCVNGAMLCQQQPPTYDINP